MGPSFESSRRPHEYFQGSARNCEQRFVLKHLVRVKRLRSIYTLSARALRHTSTTLGAALNSISLIRIQQHEKSIVFFFFRYGDTGT